MGVLACNRNGCENIMCDRLSHNYGYICYECFEELINIFTGDSESIKTFMGSHKNSYRRIFDYRSALEREFSTGE